MLSLLFALSLVHADPRVDCAARLAVPAPFAAHFARYTNAEFVVPLPFSNYVENGIWRELHVYSQSLDDFAEDDPQMLTAFARVRVDNSAVPRWMAFEALTLSDQLDPGFTYRTLLAHLLDKMPQVREIDFDFYALPDYGATRGRLMRGMDPQTAMARSDAAEALRDYGFTTLTPRAEFVDEQGPRELILRMRASRP